MSIRSVRWWGWWTVVGLVSWPTPGLGQTGIVERVPNRQDQRVATVLTISGGISLGSYQAGVNWALLEVIKRTGEAAVRAEWNLPHYDIRAMAGASAGNINGFLTAIEWCRTREPVAPEKSLLWMLWLGTGFDQLMPPREERQEGEGLFSRRYFREVLFDTVTARTQRLPPADSLVGCRVPIGVTITRLEPDSVRVAEGLYAANQRFAAVTTVERRATGRIHFVQPRPAIVDTRTLGAMIVQPAGPDGVIPHARVFDLMQASSAVPAAFAPMPLRYRDSTGAIQEADFSDGGLFDNNPVDLAVSIYNATNPPPTESNAATLIYISPDRLRDPYASTRTDSVRPAARGGISAVLRLAGGAVPAARQYELQVFARRLDRDPQIFPRDRIRATDRSLPVIGEQLGAFAGFLGRPFREHDFYVGIYDGLSFFARESCRTGAGTDAQCVENRLRSLIATRRLDFGEDSTLVREGLGALYRWEHGPTPVDHAFRYSRGQTPRRIFLHALLRANAHRAMRSFDDGSCRSSGLDAIRSLLCHNGFTEILSDFADPAVLAAIDQAIADVPGGCPAADWRSTPARCVADESFRFFVKSPERFLSETAGRMADRLWRIERARERKGEEAWLGVATLSELAFHSTIGYRYRRGFDLNTSSVPRGWPNHWLVALLPNYVSINLGVRGAEFGYRPALHVSNRLTLGATIVPVHTIVGVSDRWIVGPTVHWKGGDWLLSGLESGAEWAWRWGRHPVARSADRVFSLPLTAYLFGDKVRISARFVLSKGDSGEFNDGQWWTVGIGLADVNGLFYRLVR